MKDDPVPFEALGLSEDILRTLREVGYTTPTPIQQQAIPTILMGRDVFGCAQTGTGKTASFTLPIIEILTHSRSRVRMPRALILAPTRELAQQVAENFKIYSKHHALSVVTLIGGESFIEQDRILQKGVDVLIATPGRLLDVFERGKIILTQVQLLVIDEADRMLDMGFIPDIERIIGFIPPKRQTLLFSATMPEEIKELAKKFLDNPKEIIVAPTVQTAATITQYIVSVKTDHKQAALLHILKKCPAEAAIIFCNRKKDIEGLCRFLVRHSFRVGVLHGDLHQSKRVMELEAFRKGEVQLLVASNVAARGIDINELDFVFNYDVPTPAEDYVHRIGRTGRAGREGQAFTFVDPKEMKTLRIIEKLIEQTIPEYPMGDFEIPTAQEQRPVTPKAPAKAVAPRAPSRELVRKEPRQEHPRKEQRVDLLKENILGFGGDIPAFMFHGRKKEA